MAPSAVRKTSAKFSKSTGNAPHRSRYSTHSALDRYDHDGTMHGVSRPAIKKFVDSKYHLSMNTVATGQLNRAIAHGTHSGDFVLPKGPSGKVKLAPKRVGEIVKENKQSSTKHAAVTKARGTAKQLPISTTKTQKPPFTEERPSETRPATRKYTSMAKKARVSYYSGETSTSKESCQKARWR
ncbi:hypothetical protein J3R82DRAFT_5614 [Butyriboletus roseoflavus]|nr:hypothetical protein J3R82DRAFT_5614 [Butyriboletus roseoflavus]